MTTNQQIEIMLTILAGAGWIFYLLERMKRKLLEIAAQCVKEGVLQTRDVDRAQVYKNHLGENLRPIPKQIAHALKDES